MRTQPAAQPSSGRRVWRNWAGTATATPARWSRPRNEAEISAAVKDAAAAGLTVRALGSGHSFTAAAATSGVALDLSGWTGITAADTATGLVTVRSGTTLRALNAELDGLGLAMANLGDIDAQTLAGALSTGTHGTGARLGGLATQVEALELVLADGSVVTCSASSQARVVRRGAGRPGRARRDQHGDAALRAVVHAAGRRAPGAGGRGPRAVRRAGRGQRPLRVLLVPLRPPGPGQAEQPADWRRRGARYAGSGGAAGLAAVLGVRGDGERWLRGAVPSRPGQAAAHPRAEQVLLGRALHPDLHRHVAPGVRDPPPGPLRRVRVRRST